jgi:hypothetical protein
MQNSHDLPLCQNNVNAFYIKSRDIFVDVNKTNVGHCDDNSVFDNRLSNTQYAYAYVFIGVGTRLDGRREKRELIEKLLRK